MSPNPMILNPATFSSRAGLERGFSLIELMIAITLGLLILAGMLTVFVNTSATRNEIDRANRQIENGRYAMELLREDIQLAGFYGEIDMASLPAVPASLPDPCSTTLLERTLGGDAGILRFHVQGVNNYNPAAAPPDNLSCLTGANAVKPGTDVLVVRRVKTCTAGSVGCDPIIDGKPYLQASFCAAPTTPPTSPVRTHTLMLRPSPSEFVHLLRDCTTASPLRPYVIYVYFVGRSDNVLKRAEFTGTAMGNVTSLVDGIENLQVDYGVDTSGDGNPDSFEASPAAVTAWSNAVTVRINLLARNPEASPDYKGSALEAAKTYNLGPSAGAVGPFSDGFRRHVYSSVVRIQNISGIRERP
jgi:type IV pilus assembly protein PilW